MAFYKNIKLRAHRRGFTLIELVMVIVILGALAAVSLPKFIDLSEEASSAKLAAAGAAITAGSQINNAAIAAGSPNGVRFTRRTVGGVNSYGCDVDSISKIAKVDLDDMEVFLWEENTSLAKYSCTYSTGRATIWPTLGFCSLNMKGGDPAKAIKVPLFCGLPPSLTPPY